MITSRRRAAVGGILAAAIAVLGAVRPVPAQVVVPTKDPAHPKIRYTDSLVSLNDRCAVRGGTLNPLFHPVYVNGRPIGFC